MLESLRTMSTSFKAPFKNKSGVSFANTGRAQIKDSIKTNNHFDKNIFS